MQFSAVIQNEDIFPAVILKDERSKTEAVIYSFGAMLNSFVIDGHQNIIDAYQSCSDAKENFANGFKSCKLSPFVCRVKNGEYAWQHHHFKTGKFFWNKEALHGLLYDSTFLIKASGAGNEAAFVTLETYYSNKEEGFPFEYACAVTYKLEQQNKLSITTVITNHANKEMPLCDGWHPYFKFDQPLNHLLFQINTDTILEFDDRLLPTGTMLPFNDFKTLKKINDTAYDSCFLLNDAQQAACTIEDEQHRLRLDIFPDENYPYMQIFTPQHRNSIAIENLSAAPDAFNNKMGLITLKPEESKAFTTVFQAQYF